MTGHSPAHSATAMTSWKVRPTMTERQPLREGEGPTHHERFGCDVCIGFEPPRDPKWRDNVTKTCDPCEARIADRIAALAEARATAGAVEGADPDRIRALLDRWATDDPEEQARTLAMLRATTPEAPAPTAYVMAEEADKIIEQVRRIHDAYQLGPAARNFAERLTPFFVDVVGDFDDDAYSSWMSDLRAVEAPASPPPLDVDWDRMADAARLAITATENERPTDFPNWLGHEGTMAAALAGSLFADFLRAEYQRLASAAPSEPGEPEA